MQPMALLQHCEKSQISHCQIGNAASEANAALAHGSNGAVCSWMMRPWRAIEGGIIAHRLRFRHAAGIPLG